MPGNLWFLLEGREAEKRLTSLTLCDPPPFLTWEAGVSLMLTLRVGIRRLAVKVKFPAGLDRDSQRQIPQYPPCDVLCSVTRIVSDSLWPHRPQAIRLLCPWVTPGKNTGVGCHALLQGNFLIQESNPHLLHCRRLLYRWFTMEAPISSPLCLNPARCRVSSESGCPQTWDTHKFFFFSPKIQTELGIWYFYLLTLTTQA